MHNIYISRANTNLGAIKFTELTFCVFPFLLLFLPRSFSLSLSAGCWHMFPTVHCEAFGCSQARGQPKQWGQQFSLNQHLFYLTMIWLGLHGNCSGFFFSLFLLVLLLLPSSRCGIQWRWWWWWSSTSCLRRKRFERAAVELSVSRCGEVGERDRERKKSLIQIFSNQSIDLNAVCV